MERLRAQTELLSVQRDSQDTNQSFDIGMRNENSGHRQKQFVHMAPFDDNPEHLDEFLKHFERLAKDLEIPEDRWVTNLAGVLSHKAREAFTLISEVEQRDYEVVKRALYERYHVTADRYQKAFRNASKRTGESHKQFYCRTMAMFDKWIHLEGIPLEYRAIKDLILREQIMNSYNTDLKIFLTERKTETLDQLAELADRYESAHSCKGNTYRQNQSSRSKVYEQTAPGNKQRQTTQSGTDKQGPVGRDQKQQGATSPRASYQRAPIKCYTCGKPGHLARECRQHQVNHVQSCLQEPLCINALVNGERVKCVLDTGLTLDALVEPSLVSPEDLTGESVEVRYANGSTANLLLAEVQVNSDHIKGSVTAGVQDGMAHRMILGCRLILPQASKLFTQMPEANAVETRAATQGSKGAVPLHAPTINLVNTEPEEIRKLQESDPSLESVRKRVQEGTSEEVGAVTFTKENGLLIRRCKVNGEVLSQLVVPESRRSTVLKLGHESLGSGHLGMTKTIARVTHKFYWPGVNGDVRRYVRSCDACQRLGGRKERPAPLKPMPVIKQPFKRVGVDILGHQLSKGKISPGKKKVQQLQQAERPKTKKGQPNVVQWTQGCEKGFTAVKKLLR